MAQHDRARVRWWLMLGALCVACGDDAAPIDAGADSVGPTEAGVDAGCEPQSGLAEYCENRNCPSSPAAAIARICGQDRFFRGGWMETNDCGGLTVINYIGNSTTQYHFDSAERLVGVVQSDDQPFCSGSLAKTYGQNCLASRPVTGIRAGSLCPSDDAGADDAGR